MELTSRTPLTLTPVHSFEVGTIKPWDKIETDAQGTLYHLKPSDHSIAVYDGQMRLKHRIGRAGQTPGELQDPKDFAISRSGAVYVADTGNRRVQIFDRAGQFIGGFQVDYMPRAITVNSQHEILLNRGRCEENIIEVYSPDGKLIRSFGEPRRIDFKLLTDEELPEDYMKRLTGVLNIGILDVDQSDNVYIAFESAPILRKYDRFGKLLFEIETKNARLDQELPYAIEGLKEKIKRRSTGYKRVIRGLSVDRRTGNTWVKSNLVAEIFVYNNDGKKLTEVKLVDAQGKPSGSLDLDVKGNSIVNAAFLAGIQIFDKPLF
jgi:hypothetical protein